MKTKIILLTILMLSILSVKAQYVTIPDSNFVSWLNANIPAAMSGNQMDTSHTAVTTLTSINVADDTIYDLFGIQYFTALQQLDCYHNQLAGLPSLPSTLQSLNCGWNLIEVLPPLPLSLTTLSCSQNELDSLPVLPSSLATLDCSNNQLLILPSLPPGMTSLDCSGNQLDSLPSLPFTLETLDCSENQLTVLPVLPFSLLTLNCSHNSLLGLPVLPPTLTALNCYADSLTLLPALPSSLLDLNCSMNYLDSLPSLPSSLVTLVCGQNQLPILPSLPSSLTTLWCYGNLLPALPTLPGSLINLDCSNNLLLSLPTLPPSLSQLRCSHNDLPSIPTLPVALGILFCNYNFIPALPTLPSSLTMLDCSFNPLDSLPTLPSSLQMLWCASSTLDSLPPLPSSLNNLFCQGNSLTSLPTLPSSLIWLECTANLLTSLPALPAGLDKLYCWNNVINCFPEFPLGLSQVYIFSNPFTCLPNYVPGMDSLTLLYPLCVAGDFVNNPHNCDGAEGVLGFTYTDVNTNCLKDSLDNNLKNIAVKLYNSGGGLISQTYTALNGIYHFPEPIGTYDVIIDTTSMPISPQCPSPGVDTTVSVTFASPLVTDVNFDFGCKPGYDVGVRSIVRCGLVFPGQVHSLKIDAGDMTQWYNLACAAGLSGQVQIEISGPVTFAGVTAGAFTPTITGGIYTYSIADFGTILNTKAFGLLMQVDSTAGSGNMICVYVDVTPIGGDNDSSNNSFDFCYEVQNSHDPNMKETYPEIVEPNYEDWFTYTIHFQNTGTAPAINIHLRDTLDSHLDLNTFEVIAYSHQNYTTLNGNALMIQFPDIWLADSTTSADSSKGYIQYRIKPNPGLTAGTHIYNTASIYFDFNEAIVTNTTLNLFRPIVSSVNGPAENKELNLYPNPAKENITLRYSASNDYLVSISDVTGRILRTMNMSNSENTVSITDLESGIYLMTIIDSGKIITKRFVKQ